MTTKHSNDPRPILKRIKGIVPSINDAVESIQAEHDVAKRLLKLMVLAHANLADLAEIIDQALLNSTDLTAAQSTLVSDQRASMDNLVRLADQTAGASTVINNLDVWIQSDVDTIQHFLEIADLKVMTEAARKLPPDRLARVIVAVQDAAWSGE